MRLFVGIELEPRLAAAIEASVDRLQTDLQRACPDLPVRWVRPANLHVTLVFIGEVADANRPVTIAALEPALGTAAFDIRVGGFGTFPPSGPLRVIWMEILEGAPELAALHHQINRRLDRAGEERPYVPHLTVARVKDARGASARAARLAVQASSAGGGRTRVAAATLFRSRASAQGQSYEPLLRVPLQA